MPLIFMTVCKLHSLKSVYYVDRNIHQKILSEWYYYCAECIENMNGCSNIISELVYLFELLIASALCTENATTYFLAEFSVISTSTNIPQPRSSCCRSSGIDLSSNEVF